jgi:hypothetical protein
MRECLFLATAAAVLVACGEIKGESRADKAPEAGCRIVQVDDPLNGRMLRVCNNRVEVAVAPQQGGRVMGLRPASGPEFLRNDADFTQAKDVLLLQLGGERKYFSMADSAAEAEIIASGPAVAAVQWKTEFRSGPVALTVTRRVAVRQGTSAVFFEAAVLNRGSIALPGVGYQMQLRLAMSERVRCAVGNETFDQNMLKKRELYRAFPAGSSCMVNRDNWHLAVCPASPALLTLTGLEYMFQIEHVAAPQDLPPGGVMKLRTVWQFAGAPATKGPASAFDWGVLPADGKKVEPFLVSDMPPADLPRTPIAKKQGYFGVNFIFPNTPIPLWAAVGTRWMRGDALGWNKVEPLRGQWDFSAPDKMVNAAERMGIQMIGLLYGTPSWAARDGKIIGPPKDLDVWGRHVEALVRRYQGRIHVWEIWNEPDIDDFWSGSAEDYIALLKAAYLAAKRADPQCLVMSAGMDGPGETFLQRILQLGAADYCDLIGFHPYGSSPEAAEKRMRAVWRLLNFYHVKKPVWATEVGWQAGGWKGGSGVVADEETKARCLAECYQRLRPWSEVVCWYVDMEPNRVYGLAEPRGANGFELNPAYYAFKKAATAEQPRLPIRVDLPQSVLAPAGKSTFVRGRVTNRSTHSLALMPEAAGLAADQFKVTLKADPLAAGESRELGLTVTPPPYLRAGKHTFLLAFSAEGRLVGEGWLVLDVANGRPCHELAMSDGWVSRIDAAGKEVSPPRPRHDFAFKPGDSFRQSLTLENVGEADETFVLRLEGSAAAWIAPMKSQEIRVQGGKKAWTPMDVRIPVGTLPGTHSLKIVASSRTYPDLQQQCVIDIDVVAPQ